MKIREVATGLQFPEGPVALADGSVLVVEIARGTLSRVTAKGKVQVVADLGGGPNGAAIGPDGAVYVCNNGGFRWGLEADGTHRPVAQAEDYSGGRIERVDLTTGRHERLFDRVAGQALCGPNDLVFDAEGGFYFTDLGKVRERDMDRGALYHARTDGRPAQRVAGPLMSPNGVALSPDGATLYYAETEGARLWAYDISAPGQLHKLEWPSTNGARQLAASPGGHWQRFDSMAVDVLGNLCVATLLHGGITLVSAQGQWLGHVPLPDRMPTNICFGGPGLRTAYVTLSGSGRLIAIDDWPVPGLKLNFQA